MARFDFDFWTVWGFIGQSIFFMRFVVQMIASERVKESIIPMSFWYLSIVGTLMIITYAWHRGDIVFLVGFSLTLVIYIRNIVLMRKRASAKLDVKIT